jgi:hypothetical protein
MGTLLVAIGIAVIGYGFWKFLQAIWKLLGLFRVPFMPEKKLDKELFKHWEKKEDYKEFEKKVDEI